MTKHEEKDETNAEPEDDGLTDRQRLFVWHYCVDLNATQAALRAGYTDKAPSQAGYQVLRNKQVLAAVKKRMAAIDDETRVSAGWVRKNLIRNMRRAAEAESVMNSEGEQVGVVYQGSVVNRSLELLGRNIAMFLDRQDVTSGGEPVAQMVVYPSNGREILEDDDDAEE